MGDNEKKPMFRIEDSEIKKALEAHFYKTDEAIERAKGETFGHAMDNFDEKFEDIIHTRKALDDQIEDFEQLKADGGDHYRIGKLVDLSAEYPEAGASLPDPTADELKQYAQNIVNERERIAENAIELSLSVAKIEGFEARKVIAGFPDEFQQDIYDVRTEQLVEEDNDRWNAEKLRRLEAGEPIITKTERAEPWTDEQKAADKQGWDEAFAALKDRESSADLNPALEMEALDALNDSGFTSQTEREAMRPQEAPQVSVLEAIRVSHSQSIRPENLNELSMRGPTMDEPVQEYKVAVESAALSSISNPSTRHEMSSGELKPWVYRDIVEARTKMLEGQDMAKVHNHRFDSVLDNIEGEDRKAHAIEVLTKIENDGPAASADFEAAAYSYTDQKERYDTTMSEHDHMNYVVTNTYVPLEKLDGPQIDGVGQPENLPDVPKTNFIKRMGDAVGAMQSPLVEGQRVADAVKVAAIKTGLNPPERISQVELRPVEMERVKTPLVIVADKPNEPGLSLKAGQPVNPVEQQRIHDYLLDAKKRLDAMPSFANGHGTAHDSFSQIKTKLVPLLNADLQRHWEPEAKARSISDFVSSEKPPTISKIRDDDYGR